MKAAKLQDQMKGIFDSINTRQLYDPMKVVYDEMNAFQPHNSLKAAQELIHATHLHNPIIEAYERVNALQYHDPLRAVRDVMYSSQLPDPVKEVREAIEALHFYDPAKAILDAFKVTQLQDPMKEAREAMRALRFHDPMEEVRNAMKASQLHSSMLDAHDALKAFGLDNIFKEVSRQEWPIDADIFLNNDNTVTLNSTIISYKEIQQIAGEIADKTLNRSPEHIDQVVTALASEIRALKNPALQNILYLLVYPIIIALIFSIINPITDYYIKESLSAQKREFEKTIKKHVFASSLDPTQLESFRLVTKKVLEVRSSPSSRASTVGRLYLGQVVVLIEKRKDWSLVVWSDKENQISIQGWVFSRYLSKLQ